MTNIFDALSWLKRRLLFKNQEDINSQAILVVDSIDRLYNQLLNLSINEKDLDMILSKYYYDFLYDKSNAEEGFAIGFSDEDRSKLRHNTTQICQDLIRHIFNSNTSPSCDKINNYNPEYDDITDVVNNTI